MTPEKVTDIEAMRLAIDEARLGEGFVSPNPLVGCVILDSHSRLISKGYHAAVGSDHAEADALKKIADVSQLKGAQVFVTLEPCAHEGRTPSCAKRLAELPIDRVVYGLKDPNPLVSGKGAEILIQAGKQVELFESLQDELEDLPEIFLRNMRNRRAWVTLKVASSLDGRVALANGESQWITNEKSREKVQWLRGTHDAILVGAGTVLKDNPSLNIRHPHFSEKKNKVVIIDPRGESLSFLKTSKISETHQDKDIFVVLDPKHEAKYSDKLHEGWNYIYPEALADGRLDLLDVAEKIYEKGICSVLCEGGAKVFASFLHQRAADRLILFQNISVFGEGMAWGSGFSIKNLDERIKLNRPQVLHMGDDLMVSGRIKY